VQPGRGWYQAVSSTRSRRRIPTSSTCCCRCSTTAASPTARGRTVDFRDVLIALTLNLGSEFLANLPENEEIEQVRGAVVEAVRAAFRPEFLNRLDEILVFRPAEQRKAAWRKESGRFRPLSPLPLHWRILP
jgi:hypothetical protein